MDNNEAAISLQGGDTPALLSNEKKTEMVQLFLFELDNDLYAVSVKEVDQVIKIPPVTSVPNTPPSILGIFHLRGKVIVAIDILRRMGVKRVSSYAPLYLFVSHRDKNFFAVVVDRVFSVISVPANEIQPLAPVVGSKIAPGYVKGMFVYKEPLKQRKHVDGFMIEPKDTKIEQENPLPSAHSVLWLDAERLLNQEDILATKEGSEEGEVQK